MPKCPDNESAKASAARVIYLELGMERSLSQVTKILGKPPTYIVQLEKWSRRYEWIKSAKAWDETYWKKEMAKRRKAIQKRQDELDERQAKNAEAMFQMATGNLVEHAKNKSLYAKDAVTLWKEAATLQRLAVGAATQRTEMELSASDESTGTLTIKAEFGIGNMEDTDNKDEET